MRVHHEPRPIEIPTIILRDIRFIHRPRKRAVQVTIIAHHMSREPRPHERLRRAREFFPHDDGFATRPKRHPAPTRTRRIQSQHRHTRLTYDLGNRRTHKFPSPKPPPLTGANHKSPNSQINRNSLNTMFYSNSPHHLMHKEICLIVCRPWNHSRAILHPGSNYVLPTRRPPVLHVIRYSYPMKSPSLQTTRSLNGLAFLSALAFGSILNAQIVVGPVDFSTVAATGTAFNTAYNFTAAGGSSTITSNGTYAVSSGGNQSLLFDTTPPASSTTYSTINAFGDGTQAVTVSAKVSTAGTSNSFGVHFSNPSTLTGSGQTSGAKDLLGVFTMANGTTNVGTFRFFKDNQPGAGGWINTPGGQITNFVTTPTAGTASLSGSGGSSTTPSGASTGGYYTASGATITSTLGSEIFYDVSFTYDPTAGTLTGVFGSVSATYTIATADLLGVAPSIGITIRTGTSNTATRFDDFTISVSPIPEPSTYASLAGLCVLGFAAYRRRRSA
jgi:hypothetical protein